jgi:hypothetical protein
LIDSVDWLPSPRFCASTTPPACWRTIFFVAVYDGNLLATLVGRLFSSRWELIPPGDSSHYFLELSMSRNLAPVVKVSSKNGFMANQRVVGQDVEASPPQLYTGRIHSVWSDGTAMVDWDYTLNPQAERHLVQSGRVRLHHLSRSAS